MGITLLQYIGEMSTDRCWCILAALSARPIPSVYQRQPLPSDIIWMMKSTGQTLVIKSSEPVRRPKDQELAGSSRQSQEGRRGKL